MSQFARLRQILLWAAAGAILSPYIGAPIWALTGEDRANDALPVATLAVGAVSGLAAMWRLSEHHRERGATLFSVAYPSMLAWWAAWAHEELQSFLWFAGVLGLSVGLVALVHAVRDRVARELRKIVAAMAWVVTVLAMPVYLSGTIVLPLAISLTIIARRDQAGQRSSAKSIAEPSVAV